MKRFVIMMLVLLVVVFAGYGQGLEFEQGSFDQVISLAKKKGQPVFIDVYTDWCGPCKKLSREVFPDSSVGAYFNQHFVSYQMNAEKGEGIALAKKYGVTAYPTLLWVDESGNLIYRMIGFKNPDKLLKEASIAYKEYKDPNSLRFLLLVYDEKKNDPSYLVSLMNKLKEQRQSYRYVLEQYASILPEEKQLPESSLDILLKGADESVLDDKAYKMLKKNLSFYKTIANSSQQSQLARIDEAVAHNTFKMALAEKNESMLDLFLKEYKRRPDRLFDAPVDYKLDFYLNTKNWVKYSPLVVKYLDSLYAAINIEEAVKKDREAFKAFQDKQKNPGARQLSAASMERLTKYNLHRYTDDLGERIITHVMAYLAIQEKGFSPEPFLKWTSRVLEMNPGNASFLAAHAEILYISGQTDKSIVLMQQACELVKGDSWVSGKLLKKLEDMKQGLPLNS